MPEALTLDSFNFSDGRTLKLGGTAPKEEASTALDFNAAMRKATVNNQRLFAEVGGDQYTFHVNPGAATGNWSFGLELKRVVAQ
jgi:acyl dehydratase